MEENRAMTPPNLFGIERRIAYAHRKYHSGLMWIGVIRGLAGIKFSGSANLLGAKKMMSVSKAIATRNPKRSFQV